MRLGRKTAAVAFLVLLSICAAAYAAPELAEERIPLLEGAWAPDASGAKYSFAVLGDKTSGGEGKWPIFDRAVEAINLLSPDFVITVGDQIPGHMEDRSRWDAEWAEYREHADRLDAPLFLVPGNHDIANPACYAFWREDLGRTYYSFDHRECHFLVLNTEEERFDGRGPVWQKMMDFAEADLAAHADSRHTFLFFHKPMWTDPRYGTTWQRLKRALEDRPYTAIAGHEHYQATWHDNGNLHVLQSATGGGIDLSSVKEYGAFHSFGYITVDGGDVRYAVVEPEGGIWPVDAFPASFRKMITFNMVHIDAAQPEGLGTDTVTVRATVALRNVLPDTAAIRVSVGPLDACRWSVEESTEWGISASSAILERTLKPEGKAEVPITFRVPADKIYTPPETRYSVHYRDAWLRKETLHMEEFDVVPIYPMAAFKTVPGWQLIGPFHLGPIDTSHLPGHPERANANFFKRFGPEDGYDPARTYMDGLRWFPCTSGPRGLLNFNGLMGTRDHALGYAYCAVDSPSDQLVHAAIYADNFAQVVLNGNLIDAGRNFGAPGGFTYVPLRLNSGRNDLVVKLFNNHGDWFLRFLIADPQNNLSFAAN